MKTGNVRAHKGDIAMELLKDARELFDEEHYFSAINLASAASEVLCKLCEMYDKPNPHKLSKQRGPQSGLDNLLLDTKSTHLSSLKI